MGGNVNLLFLLRGKKLLDNTLPPDICQAFLPQLLTHPGLCLADEGAAAQRSSLLGASGRVSMTPGPAPARAWAGLGWGEQRPCSGLKSGPQRYVPVQEPVNVTFFEKNGLCRCN